MQRVHLDKNVTEIWVNLVVDLIAGRLTMGADQPIGFAGEFKVDALILRCRVQPSQHTGALANC